MLSAREMVGELRRSRLEGHARGVRREADGVVPAAQHVHVEEFVVGELGNEVAVQIVVDGRGVVECVRRPDEQSVAFVGPARVVCATVG